MKIWVVILVTLFLAANVPAEEKEPTVEDVLKSVGEWMQDNLDEDFINAMRDIDEDKVKDVLTAVENGFQGTNVAALATLKDGATKLIPVLQKFEETYPYSVWLQTHLDYLDTAEILQKENPPPASKPGEPVIVTNPPPQMQRRVWVKELANRPVPPFAKNYLPQLKQAFTEEKVPAELAWLAEVESSFNPKARSPVGAAGLFQLMPATARDQNLSLWPWDERLQPEKSAHAAARFLRQLHAHYGDWQLALAAYNVGEARVDKLLKQRNAHSFDAIASRLPAETQMYVPKVEATLRKREGLTLAELKLPAAKN